MKNILIIEDDDDMASLLAEVLRDENYRVRTACDGEKGIESLKKKQYDLVLLDLKMPKISGYEVLLYIKKTSPATKVVLSTGRALPIKQGDYSNNSFPSDQECTMKTISSADGILRKPYLIEKMLSTIEELLKK